MFVRENREDSFKGIRALATAHTGKTVSLHIKRQNSKTEHDLNVVVESASRNFFVCHTVPNEEGKSQRLTIAYPQIKSGEVTVKW